MPILASIANRCFGVRTGHPAQPTDQGGVMSTRIPDHLSRLAAREMSRRTALKVMGGTTAATVLSAVAPRIAGAQSTSAAAGGPPATPTGTLRIANPGEPNFLDPAMALENYEFSIVRSVYEGLLGW